MCMENDRFILNRNSDVKVIYISAQVNFNQLLENGQMLYSTNIEEYTK